MKEQKQVVVKGGINFGGLLQVAFIILKLCNVITWKWIWVLAPLWGGFAAVVLIWIGFFILVAWMNK